jgi:glycosyltransferase involved in cell wall biosynthesis
MNHFEPNHSNLALYQNRPLRVLQIHNFYQQPGGEDVVVRHEAALLQQAGVELHSWYVDSNTVAGKLSLWQQLQLALKLLWNRQAQQHLTKLLQAQPVDIIHLHNTFPLLSPAILHTASKLGVPLVMTVHNMRMFHPSGFLPTATDFHPKKWQALRYLGSRYYRNSLLLTSLLVLLIEVHKQLGSFRLCQRLICPSDFVKNKLAAAGFAPRQLVVKAHSTVFNPQHTDPRLEPEQEQGYALFVGRTDPAKGLDVLLKAWRNIDYPLWIVGVTEAEAINVAGVPPNVNVTFCGRQPHAEIGNFYRNASLLVVPSLCAETFGNVVIEAFAQGTPCLVSDDGALPELISPAHSDQSNEGCGLTFRTGDSADLTAQFNRLIKNSDQLRTMSKNAYQRYLQQYQPCHNQQALLACYQQVLAEQGLDVRGN